VSVRAVRLSGPGTLIHRLRRRRMEPYRRTAPRLHRRLARVLLPIPAAHHLGARGSSRARLASFAGAPDLRSSAAAVIAALLGSQQRATNVLFRRPRRRAASSRATASPSIGPVPAFTYVQSRSEMKCAERSPRGILQLERRNTAAATKRRRRQGPANPFVRFLNH